MVLEGVRVLHFGAVTELCYTKLLIIRIQFVLLYHAFCLLEELSQILSTMQKSADERAQARLPETVQELQKAEEAAQEKAVCDRSLNNRSFSTACPMNKILRCQSLRSCRTPGSVHFVYVSLSLPSLPPVLPPPSLGTFHGTLESVQEFFRATAKPSQVPAPQEAGLHPTGPGPRNRN